MQHLGTERHSELLTLPSPQDHLFFDGTTIELIAGAGVLAEVCDRFKCHITVGESQRLDAELRAAAEQEKLAEWIGALMDRLSRGIDDGRYEIITMAEPPVSEGLEYDPDAACLKTLVRLAPDERDVLWIDDRWANRHLRGGAAPIVDFLDVLQMLRNDGELNESQYYSILARLRNGNVWFIPPHKDEILYHLRNALAKESSLMETTGLASLRRGLASCLLRSKILVQPTGAQALFGIYEEGAFILSWHHTIVEALADVWRTEPDRKLRIARSEWLMQNLYVDQHILRRLGGLPTSPTEDASLTALRFAFLLSKIFSISEGNVDPQRGREYMQWLIHRVLREPLAHEAGLAEKTAEIMKRIFLEVAPASLRTKRAKATLFVLHQHLKTLPESIQRLLSQDPGFESRLRLRSIMIVNIDAIQFERSIFLEGACAAINGRNTTVKELTGKHEIRFLPGEGAELGRSFYVQKAGTAARFAVNDPLLRVLIDSPSARERILEEERQVFDMTWRDFQRFVSDVASTDDPGRRMEKLETAMAQSGLHSYQELRDRLAKNTGFGREDLMPADPELLIRHFRLDPSQPAAPVSETLASAAEMLIEGEDLDQVIRRLAKFPIPLPVIVFDRVRALASEQKTALVKKLMRLRSSPVSIWHLIAVLNSSDEPKYMRLARNIARKTLADDCELEFSAYKSVAYWCATEFRAWPKARGLSKGLRLALAWAHAHQVFVIFKALGAPLEWVRDAFDALSSRVRLDSIETETSLRADVNHPQHLNRAVLLLGGLQYVFRTSEEHPLHEGLSEKFWQTAITQTESGPLIAPCLLLDTRIVLDQLAGFLGGDRYAKLISVVPPKGREVVKVLLSDAAIEKTLARLEQEGGRAGWWTLYMLVGGFAVPQTLKGRLAQLILQTDFVCMASDDPKTAHITIHIASTQAKSMADEGVRRHLTDALCGIAALLAKTNQEDRSREAATVLIDSALNIAQCAPSGGIMDEFALIVERLSRVWTTLADGARDGIQRLCEDTLMSENEGLWRLNLKLRCRK